MLKGLQRTKALSELNKIVQSKASLKGLAKTLALKKQNELRLDLGMGAKNTPADTNTSPQEYADTLLFNKSGQILLAQRSAKDDFKPNKWWIVGGKIEPDETPERGAIRELEEETGVKLSDLAFVEKVNLPSGGISHRFAGVVKDDTPIHLKKDELQAYEWVDTDKLGEYELLGTLGDLQDLVELASEIVGFDGDVERDNEAVVIDGKEFKNHNLDFEQESNKQLLRDEVRQYLENLAGDNGKYIFNHFLGRDVLLNGRGIGEMLAWSHQVIKLQILHGIERIVQQARGVGDYKQINGKKDKKAHAEYYYHLEAPIQLAGLKLTVKVIIEEDIHGLLQYDVRVPRTALGKNKALYDALTHDTHSWNTSNNAYVHHNNKLNEESQDDFAFDRLNANIGVGDMLLNLFVFDENGNEVGDEILGDGQDGNDKTELPTNSLPLPTNEKPFDRTNITIPRTKTTRQKANNQAFAILDKLDNGDITPADLTDDDKALLAQYSGNGGALKDRDGKTGSDYEYYTPKALATGMWDLAKEMGFDGGRVLDPSAGTGIFAAVSPQNALMDSVELDHISGSIAKILNDGERSTTTISPFEKIAKVLPDGTDTDGYDLVITNVPFGDNGARGANKMLDTAYQKESLDYYFILRSLEKLKSGGLAVFITTPATVHGKRKKQIELRQKTSRIAHFLGAYRLPNSVFAGTGADVSVDVIAFRKYDDKTRQTINNYFENGDIDTLEQAGVLWSDYLDGRYFATRKNQILGEEVQVPDWRDKSKTVTKVVGGDMASVLKQLKKFGRATNEIDWQLLSLNEPKAIEYQEGDVVHKDGQAYQFDGAVWQAIEQQKSDDELQKEAMYQELITKLGSPYDVIMHDVSLEQVTQLMGYLTKTAQNSLITQRIFDIYRQASGQNGAWYVLCASQAIDMLIQKHGAGFNYLGEYSAFSQKFKDVLVMAKGMKKAGVIGVSYKNIAMHHNKGEYSSLWRGAVDVEVQSNDENFSPQSRLAKFQYENKSAYISLEQLAQIDPNAVHDDDWFVFDDKAIHKNDYLVGSLANVLVKIDERLQGNIDEQSRTKLLRQRQMAEQESPSIDVARLRYDLQSPVIDVGFKLEFLKTIVPPSVTVEEVDGQPFIKTSAKDDTEKLMNRIGVWLKNGGGLTLGGVKLATMSEKQAIDWLNKTANSYNEQFNNWVKVNDGLMSSLDKRMNDPKNRYFSQNNDDAPIAIAGLSDKLTLHPHQNAFVRSQGRFFGGINGMGVGLGKTFTALASIQHAHNIGTKKRTLVVVPKSVLSNWRKEALFAYQSMDDSIFIGLREKGDKFTVSSSLFDNDLNEAIDGKYRKIFMTYEAFRRIRLMDETFDDYVGHLSAEDGAFAITESRKHNERADGRGAQLKEQLLQRGTNNAPYLEHMNIDSLVIDEAHAFKNSISANVDRIKFLSSPSVSSRGLDAQIKAWYVRGKSSMGDGVCLLTATPITNSPVEIYSMLSLAVGRNRANAMSGGIKGADDFVNMMCDIERQEVLSIDGKTMNIDAFVGLRNIDMLRSAIHSTATIKNADDVKGLSVVIPERNELPTSVRLPKQVFDDIKQLQRAYGVAKIITKDGDLELLSPEAKASYMAIKNRFGESDELLAHPFNLIRKMEVMIADPEFVDGGTFYDFEPSQRAKIEQAVQQFNKKGYKEETERLCRYTDQSTVSTITAKNGDEKYIKGYRYKVTAQFIKDSGRERIVLDTTDSQTQANFEQICEKLEVDLKITTPAKLSALLDNVKFEMANKRGVNSDGTNTGIVKQIIFCDHLFLHNKIVRLLGEQAGVPKDKIAIITGQINSEADEIIDIQNGFNDMGEDNRYQVIIANKKAEVGINLQKGTQAIHHLTTGWTPDSIEQRNGRGARQGNHTDSVNIYYYDADGTFDSLKRSMVDKKDEWISNLLQGEALSVAVAGDLTDKDKDALINAVGDEDAIQRYLAQKQKDEEQARQNQATSRQMINVESILNNGRVSRRTYRDVVYDKVDDFVKLAQQFLKAKGLVKVKKEDSYATHWRLANDKNKTQRVLYDRLDHAFNELLGALVFEAKQEVVLDDLLIKMAESDLGVNSSWGYGNRASIDNKIGRFLHQVYDKSTSDIPADAPEQWANTDHALYKKYEQDKIMAQKLINQAIAGIDEIAQTVGGLLPVGAGERIKNGTSRVIDGVYYQIGDVFIDSSDSRGINHGVVSGFPWDGDSVTLRISYHIDALSKGIYNPPYRGDSLKKLQAVQKGTSEYVEALKAMANVEVSNPGSKNTFSELLDDVREFLPNAVNDTDLAMSLDDLMLKIESYPIDKAFIKEMLDNLGNDDGFKRVFLSNKDKFLQKSIVGQYVLSYLREHRQSHKTFYIYYAANKDWFHEVVCDYFRANLQQ